MLRKLNFSKFMTVSINSAPRCSEADGWGRQGSEVMVLTKEHEPDQELVIKLSEAKTIGFEEARERADTYHRYHIDAIETEDLWKIPRRFNVKVGKFGLAKLIFKEFFKYFGHWETIFSRPCTYGVFSGPIGGFSPRPDLCVGCLRCEVQHPEFVTVTPNGELRALGDKYLTWQHISTIDEEARKGGVPVRGQGYRGKFGGPGFDGMFTDMSEIVRPSRDGIHGRELIGTQVDIGSKPMHLSFDSQGNLLNQPEMLTIQVPFVYSAPPKELADDRVFRIMAAAATKIDSIALIPVDDVNRLGIGGANIAPIVNCDGCDVPEGTRMVELRAWNADAHSALSEKGLLVSVAINMASDWRSELKEAIDGGASILHLYADHHGLDGKGEFLMETLAEAHLGLVEQGIRDKVTLLGSGGIAGADHLPKAIISGLDAVGLDHALLIAMQARLTGNTQKRDSATVQLPKNLDENWGQQRIVNLSCSWRDQMLEILGAMGVREVRRLRGEFGRSMRCADLEAEAFGDIEGFPGGGA